MIRLLFAEDASGAASEAAIAHRCRAYARLAYCSSPISAALKVQRNGKCDVVVEDGILKLVSARQRGIWDQGAGRATSDWTLAESCKFVIRR